MTDIHDPNRFSIRAAAGASRKAPVPPTIIGPRDSEAYWLEQVGRVPMTTWHNPTNHVTFADVNVDSIRPHRPNPYAAPTMVRVQLGPNERCPIPSMLDRAIHRCHNDQVIGGLCPAWRCAGSFPVSPDLIDETHAPYTGPEAA